MTGWQHAVMQYGVGYAGFSAVPALAESRALTTKTLRTMLKCLSLVMPAGKAELSLVAGRMQAKNSFVSVLGTGPAAQGWPMFSGACFPVPAGCSFQSAL